MTRNRILSTPASGGQSFRCLSAIIPRLPPLVDGIGDYALNLARLLRQNLGVETRFIVTDPAWTEAAAGVDQVEGFEVFCMSLRSTGALLNAMPSDSTGDAAVLLHYEGYGYANRGCPFWLVKALEQWREGGRGRQMITMFHELYASGPPWTSAFWLSSLQKSLAARLERVSDQWLTSVERYEQMARRLNAKTTAYSYSLPVFSSIGEPDETPPLAERQRRLVVFGTRGRRIEVYRRSAADLNRICKRLGITEILDIGRPVEFDFAEALDTPVVICGELPGAEISRLLLDAVAGVIDYPASMLGKSTIFAAYCAHRVIPFVASFGDSTAADGLKKDHHYWLTGVDTEQLDFDAGQTIADHAFAWYQTHNLSTHVKKLASCLVSAEQPARLQRAVPAGK